MKKTLLAIMALGMTMTSCMNDEFPNATRYGYINLNVSNDPVMQTRGTQTVTGTDLESWHITATKDNNSYTDIQFGENKVPAGTYNFSVKSHASIEEANSAGENNFGEAYYVGTKSVEILAGETKTIDIECGKAGNSRLALLIDEALNTEVFTNLKLNASVDGVETTRSLNATNSKAYYSPGTNVNYNITYTYVYSENGVSKTKDVTIKNGNTDFQIALTNAAYEYRINVSSSDNGNINISISIDDAFSEVNDKIFNFDAATGEAVITDPTN